jgi:hypothetical protein
VLSASLFASRLLFLFLTNALFNGPIVFLFYFIVNLSLLAFSLVSPVPAFCLFSA